MPNIKSEIETNAERDSLEITVSAVGTQLVESLSRVLGDVPGAPYRPQQLAKHLVLNKDLTSRLVRALKKRDPIAAIHVMPGPVPLRRVLTSAQKAGVSKDVVAKASSAIEAFDHLIRSEFGARADLDAAISASHPDARERHESTAKQAAFRGAAGIRGISVDVMAGDFHASSITERSALVRYRCDQLLPWAPKNPPGCSLRVHNFSGRSKS